MWLVAGCSSRNPDVCCTSTADCQPLGLTEPLACGDDQICRENECVAPECRADSDCGADLPVCDVAVGTCHGCAREDDCPSDACDFDTGKCIDESATLYASSSGDQTGPCERGQPCSLTHALELVTNDRSTVKLAAGNYTASVAIDSSSVTLHAFNATVASSEPQTLHAQHSGSIRVLGGHFINTASSGFAVKCESPPGSSPSRVIIEQAELEAPVPVGVYLCALTLSRSRLHSTANDSLLLLTSANGTAAIDRTVFDGGGGVLAAGSETRITNSLFLNEDLVDYGAAIGVVTISFSTFINSRLLSDHGVGSCAQPFITQTCIENSILLNFSSSAPADTVTGTSTGASYSIIYPQSSAVMGDHNMLGVDPQLVDPANGDYHLKAGSPAIDAADPSASDAIDYEGNARPSGAGRDVGAFER